LSYHGDDEYESSPTSPSPDLSSIYLLGNFYTQVDTRLKKLENLSNKYTNEVLEFGTKQFEILKNISDIRAMIKELDTKPKNFITEMLRNRNVLQYERYF